MISVANMVLLPFFLTSLGALAQQRQLTLTKNPGCGDRCANETGSLVHVMAAGPNDTIHHVWDFFDKPTVFLALTQPGTNLTIDWDLFFDNKAESWKFTSQPRYVFSYVLDKVIEYNDLNNSVVLNPSATTVTTAAETFNWTIVEINTIDTKQVESTIVGTYRDEEGDKSANIRIKLSAFGDTEHGMTSPHLFHTLNDSQIVVDFVNMPTTYNHSRYALGLAVFNQNVDAHLAQTKTELLDDEHSPGVFYVSEVLTTQKEEYGGYMQWKSVAYTTTEHTMVHSTDTAYSTATTIVKPSLSFNKSGVYAYFGSALDQVAANSFVVSFGSKNDGFYGNGRYLSWALLAGIGKPAEDSFSLLVISILGVGLGLPALLAVISTGCIISRRVSRTRDQLLSGH